MKNSPLLGAVPSFLPPPTSPQRDQENFCVLCRLLVALPGPKITPILPASLPYVRLLNCVYENNSYVPVYSFS